MISTKASIRFQRALTLILMLALATAASAEESEETDDNTFAYVSVRGGWSWTEAKLDAYSEPVDEVDLDAGYDVGVSAGLQLTEWVRWDVVDFSYFETTRGLSLTTGFRFGDFRDTSLLRPYITLGLGGGRVDAGPAPGKSNQWGFEATAGAGIEIEVFSHLAVGVRYKFHWIDVDVRIPPTPPPDGLTLVELSTSYQTLTFEILFY